jgi:hypothetical protein
MVQHCHVSDLSEAPGFSQPCGQAEYQPSNRQHQAGDRALVEVMGRGFMVLFISKIGF